MTDAEQVARWVEGYRRAWESNDEADIGALFADTAEYYTAPFRPPWRGRAEIVAQWLGRKDDPGETTFDAKVVAVTGDLGIVEGVTGYPDETFSNLWLIRLDKAGRCTHFTEWWMRHDQDE